MDIVRLQILLSQYIISYCLSKYYVVFRPAQTWVVVAPVAGVFGGFLSPCVGWTLHVAPAPSRACILVSRMCLCLFEVLVDVVDLYFCFFVDVWNALSSSSAAADFTYFPCIVRRRHCRLGTAASAVVFFVCFALLVFFVFSVFRRLPPAWLLQVGGEGVTAAGR